MCSQVPTVLAVLIAFPWWHATRPCVIRISCKLAVGARSFQIWVRRFGVLCLLREQLGSSCPISWGSWPLIIAAQTHYFIRGYTMAAIRLQPPPSPGKRGFPSPAEMRCV